MQIQLPSNMDDLPRPRPVSEMMEPSGTPKPKSLLYSFLFPRSSPQDRQEEDRRQQQRFHPTLSLQSNLLPKALLGDDIRYTEAPKARTVTDDVPITDESSRTTSSVLLPLPHRPWGIVSDVHKALPKVPSHYPPFDPNCTALVTDVPPSIVLVRISECLRRRSIAAEYDDESVTAHCMTVDRVHFQIQLYRAPGATFRDETMATEDTAMSLPYDTIIVEVQKMTSGNSSSLSFHAACSKILLAAKGLDTGEDERPSHRHNGMESKPQSIAKRRHPSMVTNSSRLLKRRKPTLTYETTSSSTGDRTLIAEQSLEGALELLQKDRLECQLLGIERLVNLTNCDSVGNIVCRHVCRRLLLGEQILDNNSILRGVGSPSKKWSLMGFLMHPGAEQASVFDADRIESHGITSTRFESKNNRMVRSFLEASALSAVTQPSKKHSSDRRNPSTTSTSFVSSFRKKRSMKRHSSANIDAGNQSNDQLTREELRHEARLRSLAIRVFCNALDYLSGTKELPEILHPFMSEHKTSHKAHSSTRQPSRWVKPAFLLSLVQDLQGASRPPSVSETGYKLASVHEAAVAARCLRLLAGYEGDEGVGNNEEEYQQQHSHETCAEEQEAVREFLRSEAVLERLEYARACGRAAHTKLHYEAESTYDKLTEDDRSC